MRPDLIVIVSFPAIYFAKNQLQLNNIANGIVKSKRKYSLPTKIGYNHVSFFDGNSISIPLLCPYSYKTKREVSQLLFAPLTL